MVEKIRHTTTAIIHGVIGFVVLGSMVLAAMFLQDLRTKKEHLAIEFSTDEIMEKIAQSKNYEIKCEKSGDCRLMLSMD